MPKRPDFEIRKGEDRKKPHFFDIPASCSISGTQNGGSSRVRRKPKPPVDWSWFESIFPAHPCSRNETGSEMNRSTSVLGTALVSFVWLAVTAFGADDSGRVLSYEQSIQLWGHDWVAHTANTGRPGQPAGIKILGNEARFRALPVSLLQSLIPRMARKSVRNCAD